MRRSQSTWPPPLLPVPGHPEHSRVMASKKDSNFLLYSLGSDDDDHAGDDMVYSSLLASPDSNAAFISDDDEAVDTHHQRHKAVHEVPHDVAPVPQWRMATIALWQVLLTTPCYWLLQETRPTYWFAAPGAVRLRWHDGVHPGHSAASADSRDGGQGEQGTYYATSGLPSDELGPGRTIDGVCCLTSRALRWV